MESDSRTHWTSCSSICMYGALMYTSHKSTHKDDDSLLLLCLYYCTSLAEVIGLLVGAVLLIVPNPIAGRQSGRE